MFKFPIFTKTTFTDNLIQVTHPSALKEKKKKISFRRHKRTPPGASPGMINLSEDAAKPRVRICSYDLDEIFIKEVGTHEEINKIIEDRPDLTHWIEIKGFGDRNLLEGLSTSFNIHRLEMEDVVSVYQRPKMEEAENHLFIVSRPIIYDGEEQMQDDQLSLFIGKNYVISMQEKYTDYLAPVLERLKQSRGYIRKSGSDYLAYALMDAVVDNYFPFLERLGNYLDELEDKLLDAPDVYSLQHIQASKRKLILFRRIAWSEREKLNEIIRTNNPLVTERSKRFLRDTYDHTIQIMDMIDSYREITASLMDIYLSSVSNRLNKVMKVLTIISTIFIPLTFIVGVYGMNFSYVDPDTNEKLPLNMPELYSPYGYIGVVSGMLIIVILQIYFYYKKGWLDFRS